MSTDLIKFMFGVIYWPPNFGCDFRTKLKNCVTLAFETGTNTLILSGISMQILIQLMSYIMISLHLKSDKDLVSDDILKANNFNARIMYVEYDVKVLPVLGDPDTFVGIALSEITITNDEVNLKCK